jgi:beta-glucosidase
MGEYMQIDHIDQILAMNTARQTELRKAVKDYLASHPAEHLFSEWGCLAQVDPTEAETFIDAMLETMTLEQKVNQMSADYLPAIGQFVYDRYNSEPYYAGEDRALDIPAIKFTDGPSGVVLGYRSTAFPVSMARAATFDPGLERRIGQAIGIEARSQGANFFAGVCINLLRHPGWGRAQETYGEDPFLLGRMGSSLVQGVQEHVMACVKHFAANSIENARFRVSVEMDERTLREIYLPHFKMCVDSGAAAVMSAYNRVRGQWCGHDKYLLSDILKKEWGFSGFVMSDFAFGIRGTVEPAQAGLDVEMNVTQFYGDRLVRAVRERRVPEQAVDESVRRILRQKIRFAHVGDPSRYSPERVACKEHVSLALEAARKSAVLLKNEGVLPLDRKRVKRILVAGDLAKLGCIGDSKGSSAVFPPYVVTALEGIERASGNGVSVQFARGTVSDEVRQKGRDCDAVVVYVGLTHLDEGEYFPASADNAVGGDRVRLGLHPKDIELIWAAAEGNRNTVVVLQGGSAIQVEPWCHAVKAILMQWYPGMEGGTALGEILYGDVNPSGKLPVTIHAKPQQLPYFGLDLQTIDYDFYHGYFAVDEYGQQVSYPFGYGLSYTVFTFGNPDLSASRLSAGDTLVVSVDVENCGDRAGDTVVQVYVGAVDSAVRRHKKDLRGFKRVHLVPGEKKQVSIEVPVDSLAFYSVEDAAWKVECCRYRVYAGSSSADRDLRCREFEIV